ncbi:hypothetical protein ACMDCR_10425 [Labrys okinawensis]|uniref:hypothetical protein n=1 Tax=Labrys okinawensis TaxID=346911 RepID=UPI0039BD7330
MVIIPRDFEKRLREILSEFRALAAQAEKELTKLNEIKLDENGIDQSDNLTLYSELAPTFAKLPRRGVLPDVQRKEFSQREIERTIRDSKSKADKFEKYIPRLSSLIEYASEKQAKGYRRFLSETRRSSDKKDFISNASKNLIHNIVKDVCPDVHPSDIWMLTFMFYQYHYTEY